MAELERTVVQLWEAKRLASRNDVPHGRLALLLLDNAIEISLMREAKSLMAFSSLFNNAARLLSDVSDDDEEGRRIRREIEPLVLSKTKRRKIEQDFGTLVDYVVARRADQLSAEFADCLKILHRYRNAAYHRDSVREDVLGPAVQIQFYLFCKLLAAERPIMSEITTTPPIIAEILGDSVSPGGLGWDSSGIRQRIADRVLSELNLDHRGIAEALSEHLLGRLSQLDSDLTTIGEGLPLRVTRWATLRLVQQAPTEPAEFEAEMPDDFWTKKLPVDEDLLAEWFAEAAKLRETSEAHESLRSFARIEQQLEALENPVARFLEDMDRAEQRRWDEIRGR